METKMKEEDVELASDAERLAAIRRTAQEMAAPPGPDISILVRESLDAYWSSREEAVASQQKPENFSLMAETIALARAAAWKFIDPDSEFISDAISAAAPAIITVLLIGAGWLLFLAFSRPFPSAWVPYATIGIPLVLGLAAASLFLRARTLRDNWGYLSHSLGAVVGGAIIASLLLGFNAMQRLKNLMIAKDLNSTSYALAQDQLEELTLASIEKKHRYGAFIIPSDNLNSLSASNVFWVETKKTNSNEAVYEADAKGLDGNLVANVSTYAAYLYYQKGENRELRSSVLAGKVDKVNADELVITSLDGTGRTTTAKIGPWVSQPKLDSKVIVAIDAKTSTVIKLAQF